jgi:hypothetical protein
MSGMAMTFGLNAVTILARTTYFHVYLRRRGISSVQEVLKFMQYSITAVCSQRPSFWGLQNGYPYSPIAHSTTLTFLAPSIIDHHSGFFPPLPPLYVLSTSPLRCHSHPPGISFVTLKIPFLGEFHHHPAPSFESKWDTWMLRLLN